VLKSSLEPYLEEEEVFIDQERLQPGFRFNEAIGRAICESLFMILVDAPVTNAGLTASASTWRCAISKERAGRSSA
jgi:hypothetical protein